MYDSFSIILPVAVRRLSPATQPSPVMQIQEDGDNLIPFAKCSRVVSRSPPPSLPSQSLRLTPRHYGNTFWENLSQKPRPTWMEEPYTPPLLRVTGCSQLGLYPPEGLPPPEMLCRRKRRRQHLAGMQQGSGSIPARVRAVTYHLEDLRRRQRIINELKKAQWGSSGAAPEPLGLDEDGCGQPSTRRHPDPEEERANSPREEDDLLSPGRAQVGLKRDLGRGRGGDVDVLYGETAEAKNRTGQMDLRGTKIKVGPLRYSDLRIQHCHCCDSGRCCGAGAIPGPGTSACFGRGIKIK
uniref:Inhibitor of CDK, cyclin A1 interacting protein 1 n=1 Tax=Sus scrofa TaxID=9823 RepID=A0A8D1T6E1_PIG